MNLENSEDGTISLEDAAMSLVQTDSQEQPAEPEQDDADPALEAEAEAEEVQEDQPEEDADEDDATEEDDDPDGEFEDVYLIDGKEVTASEIADWRDGNMRQNDYTKKTQEAAEERKTLQVEKTAFNAEQARVTQELQQQQAQLKEALATFAVQSMQEPNWAEAARSMEPKAYQTLQAEWAERNQKMAQAQEVHQSLQQQEFRRALAREQAALLEKRPEWGSGDAFTEAMQTKMVPIAQEFGISPEEVSGISDHRMYLVLEALADARAGSAKVDSEKVKATKRVVKAAKRVPAGSKPAKSEAKQKQRRSSQDRFKKTGDINDAVSLIMQG